MLIDSKYECLAAQLEYLDYVYIDDIVTATRKTHSKT